MKTKLLLFTLSIDVTGLTPDEIAAKATNVQSALTERTRDLSLRYEGDRIARDDSDYIDTPCNPWSGRTNE